MLGYMQMILELVTSGRTTWAKLRAFLQQEGATNEELAALDARLSTAIDAREAEHGAGSLPTS